MHASEAELAEEVSSTQKLKLPTIITYNLQDFEILKSSDSNIAQKSSHIIRTFKSQLHQLILTESHKIT